MPRAEDPASGVAHDHWFEGAADHLGSAYLRYSFTKGTEQEVEFLVDVLGIGPGSRVLDVGCGPGRHALALAARGIEVVGVDISQRFVDLAAEQAAARGLPATFVRLDARALPYEAEFDAVISLCQGAFGLQGATRAGSTSVPLDGDDRVLAGIAEAARPGGKVAVSAFSAYFQLRYLEDTDEFDARAGVNHERTELRDEHGRVAVHDLWTTCFTPRELRLLASSAGLAVEAIWSVEPGRYGRTLPIVDLPEFLLLASRS